MSELTFNQLAVYLFAVASVVSFLLLMLKSLGKEFESVALVWLRVWKRISVERQKLNGPSQRHQTSIQSDSKRGSDSVSP